MKVTWWENADRIVVEHDGSAQAYTIEQAEELYFRLGVALREANAEAAFTADLRRERFVRDLVASAGCPT